LENATKHSIKPIGHTGLKNTYVCAGPVVSKHSIRVTHR